MTHHLGSPEGRLDRQHAGLRPARAKHRRLFQAPFNRDQVKRPLHLTRGQVLTSRGAPNSEVISKVIGDAMQEVVERRRQKTAGYPLLRRVF